MKLVGWIAAAFIGGASSASALDTYQCKFDSSQTLNDFVNGEDAPPEDYPSTKPHQRDFNFEYDEDLGFNFENRGFVKPLMNGEVSVLPGRPVGEVRENSNSLSNVIESAKRKKMRRIIVMYENRMTGAAYFEGVYDVASGDAKKRHEASGLSETLEVNVYELSPNSLYLRKTTLSVTEITNSFSWTYDCHQTKGQFE